MVKLVCGEPGEFSEADRQAFIDLVRSGGEVNENTLQTNVPNAVRLALLRDTDNLIGVAALKVPIRSYRQTIRKKAGVIVGDAEFPYELGYVFVAEVARGNGHSSDLAGAALDAAKDHGVFATSRTENAPMHSTLTKCGFEKAGKPYPGKDDSEMIQLFLRLGR